MSEESPEIEEDEYHRLIEKNRNKIVKHINANVFLDQFREKSILTADEAEEIQNSPYFVTRRAKAGFFLDKIQTKGDAGVEAFLEILEYEYDHLYEEITQKKARRPPPEHSKHRESMLMNWVYRLPELAKDLQRDYNMNKNMDQKLKDMESILKYAQDNNRDLEHENEELRKELDKISHEKEVMEKRVAECLKESNTLKDQSCSCLVRVQDLTMDENKSDVCFHCQQKRRVIFTSQLKDGQHICIPGARSAKYFRPLRHVSFRYTHHFMIARVERRIDKYRVLLKIFHFDKKKGETRARLYDEEKLYDLKSDEMYIMLSGKQSELDTISRRMEEKRSKEESYNIFTNNCEHIATFCETGESRSQQSRTFVEIYNFLVNEGRVLFTNTDILKHIIEMLSKSDIVCANELFTIIIFVLLLYQIMVIIVACHEYRKGVLCSKSLKIVLFESFAIIIVLSVVLCICIFVIHDSKSVSSWLPILVAGVLFYLFKKLTQYLSEYYSNTSWKKSPIADLRMLSVGDVVSLKYYLLDHKIIVTEVEPETEHSGKLKGIHYAYCGLLKSRQIQEDEFNINLKTEEVFKCEAINEEYFPPEEVIARAKARIGETKFNTFKNRSSNFCFWAKAKHFYDIIRDVDIDMHRSLEQSTFPEISNSRDQEKTTVKVSAKLGIREVHLCDEIQSGDAIEFADGAKAIIVKITKNQQRTFSVDVIFRKTFGLYRSCQQEEREIKLNTDRLYLHMFHPVHCRTREDIVNKAMQNLRDGKRFMFKDSFINDCVFEN